MKSDVLLDVRGLKKHYPGSRGRLVKAVDGVSFTVRTGETLGLVGESGCGKTTVGRTILRLTRPTEGSVHFRSERGVVDLARLDERALGAVRRDMQIILQDPTASLNPRMTVQQILREPFRIHDLGLARGEVDLRITRLLADVGLQPEYRNRYPHQMSGGQRQRIGIARALALAPKLIVADEPVSALDVSVQGQVLNLLEDLQSRFGLTYLFIAHDLAVVRHISDRVAVMYLGKVAELAPSEDLYDKPRHPYTEALLSAVPVPQPGRRRERIVLKGSMPSPHAPPPGCRFHTRCPYARLKGRMGRCSSESPELRRVGDDHWVACHFAEELTLKGI